jgi:hypothetical protein
MRCRNRDSHKPHWWGGFDAGDLTAAPAFCEGVKGSRVFWAWFCGCGPFYTGEGPAQLYDATPDEAQCHQMDDCGWHEVTLRPST